jgi:thiamine-monophosphate kinase
MKVSQLGEFGLIEHLKSRFSLEEVGDDTACVKVGENLLLLTCDTLLEGRHFLGSYPMSAVGWKGVSACVSDIIANGGKPLYLLVTLLLPDVELKKVDELYEGITRACEFYGVKLVGGNVVKSERFGIDFFGVGLAERFVGRGSAKVGDGIFVSGTLGDSLAGLELILMEKKYYEDFELRLIERHLRPTARIDYVAHISKYANASMDISDGLSSDIQHMAKRSGLRFSIQKEKLPLSRELGGVCQKAWQRPIQLCPPRRRGLSTAFYTPSLQDKPFLGYDPNRYRGGGRGCVFGRSSFGGTGL